MIVANWPTAFVIIVGMITLCVAYTTHVEARRPKARNCSHCNKVIAEEQERNWRLQNGYPEPDE